MRSVVGSALSGRCLKSGLTRRWYGIILTKSRSLIHLLKLESSGRMANFRRYGVAKYTSPNTTAMIGGVAFLVQHVVTYKTRSCPFLSSPLIIVLMRSTGGSLAIGHSSQNMPHVNQGTEVVKQCGSARL